MVGKISTTEEAETSGATTFHVSFELDDDSRRELTVLLTAARAALSPEELLESAGAGIREGLNAGIMYQHMSNGGMTKPNPGIDALGFTLGYSWVP